MQELPTIQPGFAPELAPEEIAALSEEIRALATQRNAVIGPIPPSDGDPAPGPVMATPAVMDIRSGTPGGPEKPQPAPPGPA